MRPIPKHQFHLRVHITFFVVLITHTPILQGEEHSQCPSLAENPMCPCYNFKEGLFLECPGATPSSVRNVLSLVGGTIQSLSIYDLDSSVVELTSDLFPQTISIHNVQISQSNLRKIREDAFIPLRNSLESLSIVSSKLTNIPRHAFTKLRKLQSLDVQLNEIEELQSNLFLDIRLKKLNLKGNKIRNITTNAFDGLEKSLIDLDLTENDLDYLPLVSLKKITTLNTLRLAWNRISSFPEEVDVALPSLTLLDLSSNLFVNLKNDAFRPTRSMKTLTLFNNLISDIDKGAFLSLILLESLDLSHNKITRIHRDVFEDNKNIRTIDLSHNHIHHIGGVFSNLPHLTEIFLSENNILDIPDDAFQNSSALTVLYLEQNALRSLHEDCFNTLINLTQLHMGTNFIKKLPQKTFKNNHKLMTLSLDNNGIEDLEEYMFSELDNLREIRLQNNRIILLKRHVFSPLPGLLELHLQNNLIQNIDSNAFITLRSLQHINLQGNKLTTLGDMFPNRNSSLVSIQLELNNLSLLKNSSLRGQVNVQIMWLSQNNLKKLGPTLFNDLIKIQRLYLRNNSIEVIDGKSFYQMKKLKFLDLSNNRLSKITNETFYNLTTLEELNLYNNKITLIAKGAFSMLQKLKSLDLSSNNLIVVENYMFETFVPIKHLKLNHNSVKEIRKGAFKGLNNLNNLEMSDNNLRWEDVMQIEIPGLRSLTISFNNLTDLKNMTFSHLPSLQTIHLESSNISYLPEGIFSKNQNLLRINLKGNQLKDLHKDTFAYTGILQEINIRGNLFSEFPHVALFNITSLEILDLSGNHLTTVDFFKFIGLQNLRHLVLSKNHISSVNGFTSIVLKNLISVDLSRNILTVLPQNFFHHSHGLKEVDLSYNLFKHISSGALSESVLPGLTVLNVSGNPLNQLIQTYSLKKFPVLEDIVITDANVTIITSKDFENFPSLKTLTLKQNLIVRLSPGAFMKLGKLIFLDLSINKLENLPRERLQGLHNLRALNISNNNVRELEEFTSDLKSLQKLDISFNHLSRLSKEMFQGLESLSELHLNGNRISVVSADTFRALRKVRVVDLSHNYLEIIPLRVLRSLETQVKALSFDENPLTCNCESQDVWEWMQEHYKIVLKGTSNLRCEQPEELHGKAFLDISAQKLCDVPIVMKIGIQDIQPYSVIVSWQSRNHTGLTGYQVAYYVYQETSEIRGKSLELTARSTRLSQLSPGTKYTVCVLALGTFGQAPASSSASHPVARIAPVAENDSLHLLGDEVLLNHMLPYLIDSPTSRCTTVSTIEAFGAVLDGPFSNTYLGIANILTRRLSLVVGCCMGFIVFVVLVSVLGYMKSKKRPVAAKPESQEPPQYTSYQHFAGQNNECPPACNTTILTISDKTKPE